MQSRGVTVTVAILVVVALNSCVNCTDEIRAELLPQPSETSQLRSELLQTLRQESMAVRLEPHEMLEELARLRETAPSLYERAFYREMHKLGEEGTEACNTLTMRYIYELVSLSHQHNNDLPALANYVNFLKDHGKAKFAECAATTESLFKEKMSGGVDGMKHREVFQNIENGLDRFFMAYIGSKRVLDDSDLYELAKKVDLASDDFKVKRTLRVAKDFRMRAGEFSSAVDLLSEFLVDSCAGLQRPLNVVFGNYNIADALGAQLPSELPIRFLKLNAYNRVCVKFQTENGQEAVKANMGRQFKELEAATTAAPSSKWFRFGIK